MRDMDSRVWELGKNARDREADRDQLMGAFARMIEARGQFPDSPVAEPRGHGLIEPDDRFRKRPRWVG
jgi:hypothetical protein